MRFDKINEIDKSESSIATNSKLMIYHILVFYCIDIFFGFGYSSSELSIVLVLASIARRINRNILWCPPSLFFFSNKNRVQMHINDLPMRPLISPYRKRGVWVALLVCGNLASAACIRITGMLLQGTVCCLRVQLAHTHAIRIMLVICFTRSAHWPPPCANARIFSRSVPCKNCAAPTLCFISVVVCILYSSRNNDMIHVAGTCI